MTQENSIQIDINMNVSYSFDVVWWKRDETGFRGNRILLKVNIVDVHKSNISIESNFQWMVFRTRSMLAYNASIFKMHV